MYRVILSSLVIVILLGCGRITKPPTVEKYSKDGISFNHHSTWRVTEDEPLEDEPDTRTISVEGPNDAIVMFVCLPANGLVTVEDFAESLASNRAAELEKMRVGSVKPAEITDTTSGPTSGRVSGKVQQGILQRFSIKMLGQLVPHEARIFAVENERLKVFIMAQVNTEDLGDTTPAFELILDSVSLADEK